MFINRALINNFSSDGSKNGHREGIVCKDTNMYKEIAKKSSVIGIYTLLANNSGAGICYSMRMKFRLFSLL